ncbi:hypothetical protein RRG08_049893 [Elysia crispata]|uniref:Uncharacterized protein n=1 Tax=Elysia crispata TaxID=231223 RepID=A0AAE0XZQ4_9GAST|nr:hypothetical protein RRG08_049893 [Elysia crispata]
MVHDVPVGHPEITRCGHVVSHGTDSQVASSLVLVSKEVPVPPQAALSPMKNTSISKRLDSPGSIQCRHPF